MSNVLSQALWLTIVGMGMTFLSIGALVGGIYLLIYLTRAREKAPMALPAEPTGPGAEAPTPAPTDRWVQESEPRRRAVAAAAAVAMALAAERRTAPAAGDGSLVTGAWNAYARGLHLSSRSRYESRRRSH